MKSAKEKTLKSIFFVILLHFSILDLAQAKIEVVLGNVPLAKNKNLLSAIPDSPNSEIIISRDQYVISYNKKRRAPNWVAWKLDSKDLGSSGRAGNFSQDTELEDYLSQSPGAPRAVTPAEYKGSCFDRGHQVPSADRTDTPEDNKETFLMSNMVPQTPYLNQVIWEHLEQYTRELVLYENKKVYVVAGPIYDENFGAIGPFLDIPVPSKNFKVIVILEAHQTPEDITPNTPVISVVMPNTLQDGSKPLKNKTKLCKGNLAAKENPEDWQKYRTALSKVEKLSGFKLFSKLN